uniref:RING-type domain-containing protein n=1 Tax=Hordeum vulgare subsp. vulgare TaxID=112509 RepID=Q8S3W9_HORVV|nr:hypothetical protein T17F15.140-like protein [Hordeum vulgare subsp. vulgare]
MPLAGIALAPLLVSPLSPPSPYARGSVAVSAEPRGRRRALRRVRCSAAAASGGGSDAGELSHATLLWRAAKLSIYSVALVPLTVGAAAAYNHAGLFFARRYFGLLAAASLVITWLNLSNDVYDSDTGADKNNKESVVNIVGSEGGGGGSLEDMELALDGVGGLEDGAGGLLLQHVPPGLPAGRGGLEAVGGVGLVVAELREGERRGPRGEARDVRGYVPQQRRLVQRLRLVHRPQQVRGDDDCGTVRDWIADCVAVGKWLNRRHALQLRAQQGIPVSEYGVLVDMIGVPDWAFEAVGLELRGMGQDTAYHPGLYLTTAQREAVEALIQELTKFMLKAVPTDCSECPIYLEEFKVGNEVCGLPCVHNFHVECIDQWLRLNVK